MTLRAATPADAGIMAAVHADAFAAPWSAHEIAGLMAGPGGYALLIEDGAAANGFILCRAIGDEAEILTLAVRFSVRRAGAGRALVEAAMSLARAAGAETAFLEVAQSNVSAIALYRSCGFAAVGRRVGYYAHADGPSEDALVLRRDLHA